MARTASAQDISPEEAALIDRPISRVDIQGLQRVPEQKVRNMIRTAPGIPFDPQTVALDVRTLERLGDFRAIRSLASLAPDGSVIVTFVVDEQPLLADVQVIGNRVVSDQDLLAAVPLIPGVPVDEYLIDEGITRIKTMYRDRGYYLVEVAIDEQQLRDNRILIFQVIEGPRVKVRAVEFEGNEAFSDKELSEQVDTKTAIFILRKGVLDEEIVATDVASLVNYHKDRGYLDIRVDSSIEISPDSREAKVVFLIDEGRVYTMRSVTLVGVSVFAPEQLAAAIDIKSGDVYSQDKIRKSIETIENRYGGLGYYPTRVRAIELRTSDAPTVDLRLEIQEGQLSKVGLIQIQDNFLTKDKVVRRHLTFEPGRPVDTVAIEDSRQGLVASQLFTDPTITVQEPDPLNPEYRDVLVQVEERNTGSFNFGLGVGSDSGVFGDISLIQRNFDIGDPPESLEELFRGRAFRGAGQRFALHLQPGNEVSQYSLSITEPYLFEAPLSFTASGFYRQRQYNVYDEDRVNGMLQIGRRIGEYWTLGVSSRVERVHLTAIAPFAPTAVFDAEGPDLLTAAGLRLVRSTVGTRIRPGRGSVLELGIEQTGLYGGDFDFTTVSGEYTLFLTLDEDFLGRASILRLNTRVAHIFDGDGAPVYERFYLGGRTFRGFDFRTVSPKGIRADNGEPSDEAVGGDWLFFFGAQYEFPIFEEAFNGVVFVDSGTVSNDVGFDDYRVSAGFGLRLYIDAFGPVPIAFDFGFPILKEDDDETQIFSFSAELPF